MDRKEAIRKACLTATLAVAWAGSSSPAKADGPSVGSNTVYIRTSFFHSLTNAHFVAINSLTYLDITMASLGSGAMFSTVTLGSGTGSGGNGGWDRYAIVGLTSLTQINGVAMGFNSGPGALGRSFESIFPGFTEPQIVDALTTSSPVLQQFFSKLSTNSLAPLTIDAPLPYDAFHFSDATPFGTIQASFAAIPEPVSGMVCLGALGFGRVTRRRVP